MHILKFDAVTEKFAVAWTITKNGFRRTKRAILAAPTAIFDRFDWHSIQWGIGIVSGLVMASIIVSTIVIVNLIVVAALAQVSMILAALWLIGSTIAVTSWVWDLVGILFHRVRAEYQAFKIYQEIKRDPEGFTQRVNDEYENINSFLDRFESMAAQQPKVSPFQVNIATDRRASL